MREELTRLTRESRRMVHYREYLMALYVQEGHAEQEQRFTHALATCREMLTAAASRALALRYQEALDLEEVAAALGRTPGATRQLLFRAREFLRTCVGRRLAAE